MILAKKQNTMTTRRRRKEKKKEAKFLGAGGISRKSGSLEVVSTQTLKRNAQT